MTKKEAKELLHIIQAYAEGKDIEMFFDNKWITGTNLDFTLSPENYRIKPELEYRPFKTKEECWDEMLNHQPFGWVLSKVTGSYGSIGSIIQRNNNIEITFSTNEDESFSTERLFNNHTFADGTPFGIKE